MFHRLNFPALLAATTSCFVAVNALPKITRTGRYLYSEDGSRFVIKGIAYQEQGAVVSDPNNPFGEPSSFIDPLADSAACTRDAPFLKQLGVNAVRVYSVDSTLNHDSCMQTLSSNGIYTLIDLSLPLNGSIDRTNPAWSTNVLNQYLTTIDVFSKYDNVLGYNVANEAILQTSLGVSPFVKAAARDVKSYLKSKSSSALVGYAAIDGDPSWRNALADFLSCGSDGLSIDLYGLNNYEWCGDSTFANSYQGTTSNYADYNVVAYFSEFGCVSQPPRLWTEVAALFSSQMTNVWSGGIAFSYFPASSADGQFGMVTISSDGKTVTTSDDFNRLQSQYSQASTPTTPSKSSASDNFPACTVDSSFAASTNLPPTPDQNACSCLSSTLSCKFTPATANYSSVLGELVGTACGLLSQKGVTCADIGGNGTTGTYGRLSGCDPTIKLSYVMSEFYEAENRAGQACSFSGNGTVNPLAPSSASAANSAASSCIANPSATFTPGAPSNSVGGGSTNSGTQGGNGNGNKNAAVALVSDEKALFGMASVLIFGALSAVWTLL